MSSIFFYEFLDELPYLKKLLINNKNILIISTNYIASQQLIRNNINFKELYEFYKAKENYEKHLKHSLNIPKLLEKSLFNNFKSLKENKWNIFEGFFYPIKIVYDQIYYFSNCVNEILTKYKPKIIYVKYNQKIEFTSQFLFSSNQSVLFHLLKSSRQKIKIKSINKNIYKKNEGKNSFFSFGQAKNKLKYFIFEKNKLEKGIRSTKKNIISLSCHETNTLIKAYPALKKSIINLKYSENKLMDKKYKKQNYDFTKELNKDSNIKKFFFINNFDISEIFITQISNILLSIENQIHNQIFNLGSNKIIKVKDLMRGLIKFASSKSNLINVNPLLIKPVLYFMNSVGIPILYPEQYKIADKNIILNTDKAKDLLKWDPKYDDDKMIHASYSYWIENKK